MNEGPKTPAEFVENALRTTARRSNLDGEQAYHDYLMSHPEIPKEVKDAYLMPAWLDRQKLRVPTNPQTHEDLGRSL